MADYWKSQPKKFCDYCKCWIADNKPSIEFHERGKNHKENVEKKISEIKKKSLDKAKEEEKMSKEFAAMEEAAMKAYQEDLKRLGVKAESVGSAPKKQEEKQEKKAKKKKQFKTPQTSSATTKEWVQGFSPEGYLYYYNTISGESQWEKPEGFENNPQESQMPGHWVEGVNEEGQTYFYNTVTGVSTWEKPDGLVSSSSESCQKGNHTGEALKADPGGSESEARKGSSQSKPQKPPQNVRKRKSDGEKKPSRPKKTSPYGKWQAVNPESIEHKEAVAAPPPAKTSQASSAPAKPFGEWEEITEEEDPYEKVDLELPSTEGDVLPAPVLEEPEDARIIFKEKTVTSVSDTQGGVSVFKKRKFENGKTRNIRQRVDDS